MHARWPGVLLCALAVLAPLLAGCGDGPGADASSAATVPGRRLTLYSSLPRRGPDARSAAAVENGIRLALRQARDTAGPYRIAHVPLDDATTTAGGWDPERTSANARRAAEDRGTIAYVGDFNARASAISIPTLNEAGIPQVSPSTTAVGLTSRDPGAEPGEPVKYYPAGRRTFARVIPRDTVEAAALVAAMEQEKCTRVGLLHEPEAGSAGMARSVARAARTRDLIVVGDVEVDPEAPTAGSLASRLRSARHPCAAYLGTTARPAVRLLTGLHAARPGIDLFASHLLADPAFVDPRRGGVSSRVAASVLLTRPSLPPEAYGPEGRRFLASYRAAYGQRDPDPYAIYGYESARLLLDAIRRAGPRGNDRRAVLEAIRATRDRRSALGRYGIDRRGDTTLRTYGAYRIGRGSLRFDRAIAAPPE